MYPISHHASLAANRERRNRTWRNAGFTIAEQLITIAIMGLVTLAIAVGIGIASRSYEQIKLSSDATALLTEAVAAVSDELRFGYDIEAISVNSSTVYAFESTVRGFRLYLGDSSTEGVGVYAVNATDTDGTRADFDTGVDTSALIPLIDTDTSSSGSSGSKFIAHLDELSYDTTTRTWTVDIRVVDETGDTTLDSGEFTVKTVNDW
jgi:type II secretory pathway pseudopilin PulG